MLAVVMKRHIPFFVALCMLDLTTGAVVLRLVPGPNKGVLQILHNNTWGTLCTHYYFGSAERNVVCRHLGFNTTNNILIDLGSLTGSVKYFARFNCNGRENNFNDCPDFNLTRCSSSSTVGIACLRDTEGLITLGHEKIRVIEEGGSLYCSVYAIQSVAYVWTKNGNIESYQASNVITLKRTDSGNWTCTVYSRTGTKLLGSDSVIVTVMYHPQSLSTRTMYAQRGDTVNLSRSDISLPPPHVYRWRQAGLDSEFTESTKPPVIPNIQLNHKGDFILDVTNTFPSGRSDAGMDLIKLYVSYAPSVKCEREVSVVVGQSLNLECDVDAYPDPHTLTWSHITAYQKEVSSMTEKFRIPEASHSDGGLYKCEARNNITNRRGDVEVGVGACTIRVTVHDSSEASTLPVVAAKSYDKGGNSMTTVVYVVGSILVMIALCLVIVLVVLTLKRLPMKGNGTAEMKKTERCPDPPEEEHAYEGLSIR